MWYNVYGNHRKVECNMTDEQIMDSLYCCDNAFCEHCHYKQYTVNCTDHLCRDAFELVKRLREEKVYLQSELNLAEAKIYDLECHEANSDDAFDQMRVDTVKEFAEKVKFIDGDACIEEWVAQGDICYAFNYDKFEKQIDNIVKEMVGDEDV